MIQILCGNKAFNVGCSSVRGGHVVQAGTVCRGPHVCDRVCVRNGESQRGCVGVVVAVP